MHKTDPYDLSKDSLAALRSFCRMAVVFPDLLQADDIGAQLVEYRGVDRGPCRGQLALGVWGVRTTRPGCGRSPPFTEVRIRDSESMALRRR